MNNAAPGGRQAGRQEPRPPRLAFPGWTVRTAMSRSRVRPVAVAALALCLASATVVSAENTDPANDGSQYAWGENVGWLNAEPSGDGGPGVQVGDSELSGFMWGENIGWVSLSCVNTDSCATIDYGVVNDGKGNLSGFAWAENVGWINFRTSSGSDCCIANGTPGCSDSVCEASICPSDDYCCNNNWDSLCANSASAEPACSPGCAPEPFGVRIHAFNGSFSGQAWAENVGWITFGTAPVAEPYQIETAWRCPDPDQGLVCTSSDNCPTFPNSGQGPVLFGQTVLAASNDIDFGWPDPVEWQLATGTFIASGDIGTYVVDFFDQGFGTVYTDLGHPAAGTGYWYMFRPNCLAGSYSTGTASEQGDRDGALIP